MYVRQKGVAALRETHTFAVLADGGVLSTFGSSGLKYGCGETTVLLAGSTLEGLG